MSEAGDRSPRALAEAATPLIERLAELAEGVGLDGAGHDLDAASLQRLMDVAVRLYAVRLAENAEAGTDTGVSTTEAVTAISGLMHGQDLNTFDLAVWQSKLRRS